MSRMLISVCILLSFFVLCSCQTCCDCCTCEECLKEKEIENDVPELTYPLRTTIYYGDKCYFLERKTKNVNDILWIHKELVEVGTVQGTVSIYDMPTENYWVNHGALVGAPIYSSRLAEETGYVEELFILRENEYWCFNDLIWWE